LSKINQLLKSAARGFGVEIDRVRPMPRIAQMIHLCKANECRTLLDIGANAGQYAQHLWNWGFSGRIISFEPQEEAYSELVANASKVKGWDVAARICVGDKDGMASFNLSENSVSSSLLPVLESSTSVKPETAYVGQAEVPLRRLDSWVKEELTGYDGAIAVKVDVQGFEDGVLRGAEHVLERIRVLELEMSLTNLYEGAPSFIELYAKVEAMGFTCVGLYPGFTDWDTYQMLQVDGLFTRQ